MGRGLIRHLFSKGCAESLNDKERLYSAVGSGQDIICYYDAKNNLIVTYVEQHDDSVGGSEVHIRDGVIAQNCNYNDHAPLMASNGAVPRNSY